MTTTYRDPLEILSADYTLPEGYDSWGIKSVGFDGRTRNGFEWPEPGRETARYELDESNLSSCPRSEGDGLCVATTWAGMASGGYRAFCLLLVAYRSAEARGNEAGKFRVPQVAVVARIDGEAAARRRFQGANLEGAYLRGANLNSANLYNANLYNANLYNANLHNAYLRGANLRGAYLYNANLHNANLRGAYLRGTYLYGANLDGANLYNANLRGADLYGAYLYGANLRGAYLYGANLRGADLDSAELHYADLRGADLPFGWTDEKVRERGGIR